VQHQTSRDRNFAFSQQSVKAKMNPNDDEDKKANKGLKPTLVRHVGRVTVILPAE